MEVEDGADAGGGGNLDGAPDLAAEPVVVDLAGVGDLHELAVAATGDGAERDDDVLERDGDGVLEDVLQ